MSASGIRSPWSSAHSPRRGAQLESELREQLTRNLGEDRAALVWMQSKEVFRSTFREFGTLDEVYTLALDASQGFAVWNGLRRPDQHRFESWGNSTGPIDLGNYPEPVQASFQSWLKERPAPVPSSTESPQPQSP